MKKERITLFQIFILIAMLAMALAACGGGGGNNGSDDNMANNAENMNENMADDDGDYLAPPEVIYGLDGRQEACQQCSQQAAHPDEALQALARSVAILVRPQALDVDVEGELVGLNAYSLGERLEVQFQASACQQERFSEQPAPGFCTAFLVGEDTMLTAGHCIPDQAACENTQVVFGFEVGTDDATVELTPNQIYSCNSLVESGPEQKEGIDYALFTLDRAASEEPLSLASVDAEALGSQLAVIGHPSGLPKKISADGFLTELPENEPYFIASLDTFGGNSGSPVIDMVTYTVVGMLVGGESDYVYHPDLGCYAVNICELYGEDCSGEQVLNLAYLLDVLAFPTLAPFPSSTPE